MAVECGCKWNNKLSHEIFEENVGIFGKDKALQILRSDINSWVRERDGKTFNWTLRVKNDQLVSETNNKSITGMIEDSLYTHGDTVAANIKDNAPLELATAHEVTRRAVQGEERIVFPEYFRTEKGETVVRYFTVLTKDKKDPRLYHGSRIDLEENLNVSKALEKVGEKVVIAESMHQQTKTELVQPKYSTVHRVISEVPLGTVQIVSHTISEVSYTSRSVQRYIEKRRKKNPKSVDIWKRIMESGRKKVRGITRRRLRLVEPSPKISQKRELKKKERVVASPVIYELTSTRIKQSVEKSIARHMRKEKKKIMKPEARHTGKKIERKLKIQMKRKSGQGILFAETRELNKRGGQKEIRLRKRVEKIHKERVVRLLTLVKKFIQIRELIQRVSRTKLEKVSIRKVERKRKVQEHVLNFSIAFIYWLLLAKPKNVLMNEYKSSKKESKRLLPRERTPWLLFAIIWHLTMIREQGQARPLPKQKKAKIKTCYPQFKPQGVIFAYAS